MTKKEKDVFFRLNDSAKNDYLRLLTTKNDAVRNSPTYNSDLNELLAVCCEYMKLFDELGLWGIYFPPPFNDA